MTRKFINLIWLVMLSLMANSVFCQVEIDDTIITNFWNKWANVKNGKAGESFDEKGPGYVYKYKLAEKVSIPSNNEKEEKDSEKDEGAIVLMVPTGTKEEMPPGLEYAVSTDEAMGYGMLLAVMMNDQVLFNKFLRVVNYFDDLKNPTLTSWIIPAKKGDSLRPIYNKLQKQIKEFEGKEHTVWVPKKDEYGNQVNDDEGNKVYVQEKRKFKSWTKSTKKFDKWSIKHDPKYTNGTDKVIEGIKLIKTAKKENVSTYAMDGELDIAFALLLAHDKWVLNGNTKYKYLEMSGNRYKAIIKDVLKYGTHEYTDSDKKTKKQFYLPTGPFNYSNYKYKENIDSKADDKTFYGTRPCDWMLSHLRAFYEMSGDVYTRELIGTIQEQMNHFESTNGDGTNDTGLVPDFAFFENKESGKAKLKPVEGVEQTVTVGESNAGDFYMNASRYAGRMAMDYLMYKDKYSLSKAIDIIKYLGTKEKPFLAARNIETGIIPTTKINLTTGKTEKADHYWDNKVLKASLLMAAGADKDDKTLKAFYDKHNLEKDFLDDYKNKYYGEVFGSQFPPYLQKLGWKSDKDDNLEADFPLIGADPGATEYFNDTWILLSMGFLDGKIKRPHAYKNELAEASLDSWKIVEGSQYASISYDETAKTITVEIKEVPSSKDAYAISIGTDDFTSWPGSGFGYDMLLERNDMNGASSMKVKHSYPGLADSKVVELDEKVIASDIEDIRMHYMGHFGPAKKGYKNIEEESKIVIGINSGIKVGSKLIFSDFGLFDPPGDAARYRYVGPWRSDKSYEVSDYVRYNMETYQCIKDHNGATDNHPEARTDLWEKSDYTLIGTKWTYGDYYYRGDLVHHQGRTYVCQVSFQSFTPPAEAPSVWMLYYDPFVGYAQDWFEGAHYRQGDYALYQGNAYVCKTEHKSISSWNPKEAWTLWEKANYLFIDIDPQPWETWTPYETGAIIMYNDVKYKCVIGHTAQPGWEPGSVPTLWVAQ